MAQYLMINGPMPTTSAAALVTTGTSLKTMQQLVGAIPWYIRAWGYSTSGFAAAANAQVELLATGAIAATVTTYAAADIMPYDDGNGLANTAGSSGVPFNLGTALSGYTASAEGTIVATRLLDPQQTQVTTAPYVREFSTDARPKLKAAEVCRVRVLFAAALNMQTWILAET